jgi:hypothetical protein
VESDLYCLDGFFCADGYVTVDDALATDWRTERKNLCPQTQFGAGLDLAAYGDAALPASAGTHLEPPLTIAAAPTQGLASLPEIHGRFLVAAKRYLHREGMEEDDFLSDRLYGLDGDGNLVDGPFQMAKDRLNGKLVRDPAGGLYQLNLELGLVRLADDTVVVDLLYVDVPIDDSMAHGPEEMFAFVQAVAQQATSVAARLAAADHTREPTP